MNMQLESQYNYLIESIPQKIFYKDKELIYVSVNSIYARDFGMLPQEIIGKTDYDLFPKEIANKKRADEMRIMNSTSEEIYKEGDIVDSADRTIRIVRLPVKNSDGDVIGLLGIDWDITDRVRSEESLRIADELYKTLANNAKISIFIAQGGKVRYANPYLPQSAGYSEENIIGRKVLSLVHPEDRENVKANAIDMLRGRRSSAYEYRIIDKSGKTRWLLETVSSIKYKGKKATLGSSMDITERKNIEMKLRDTWDMLLQSEKLASLGKMAAGVAHEILNPINILSMRLQFMEMTENLSEDANETIRICKAQIDRIVKITRDMNLFSQNYPKYVRPENINEIIAATLNLSWPLMKMEDIKKDLYLCSYLPSIPVDKHRIEQMILNLINNSIDAMDGKKERILRIVTNVIMKEEQRYVQIMFSDTGTGIKPEIMNRIFEPFYTTKPPGKGTGLGLSTCFWIVQDHGGSIWAENNAVDGATFIIELPTGDDLPI